MSVQPPEGTGRRVLATDLDGTLIPLEENRQNQDDLQILATQLIQREVPLLFVTGRHLDSVIEAINEFHLPQPGWIICDVGTSLFARGVSGGFEPVTAYWRHQDEIITSMPIPALRDLLRPIKGLRLQEQAKQGRFKLSFYANAADLGQLVTRIQRDLDQAGAPYSIVHSVDPFNGDGLIDLLPAGVSKAHALSWWTRHTGRSLDDIVYAGDSGNDLAALTAGYRAILVGNADRDLAERIQTAHQKAGWKNRLYVAGGEATSGVLEGCHKFEIF